MYTYFNVNVDVLTTTISNTIAVPVRLNIRCAGPGHVQLGLF